MTDQPENLLVFPCRFPIKVMGREAPGFYKTAVELVEKHAGNVDPDDIRNAPSSKGNFVSLTITITAESQEQLDAIYRELSDHEQILVAL